MEKRTRLVRVVVAGAMGLACALGTLVAAPAAHAAGCDSANWGTGGAKAWCWGYPGGKLVRVVLNCKSETSSATTSVYGPWVRSVNGNPASYKQWCPSGYYRSGHNYDV